MSLKTLFASVALGVFLTSFCLAEDMAAAPGKSIPQDAATTVEEDSLVLESAPVEPDNFISITEVQVTPSSDTAEVVFTTNIPTYATIQYGVTAELESGLMTETMTAHSETLAGLTACRSYSYRVLVTSSSDVNLETVREGTFMTTGCTAKKVTKKVVAKTPAPLTESASTDTLEPLPAVVSPAEAEMLTLPLESDLVLDAAPETIQNTKDKVQNENEWLEDNTQQALPESPQAPMLASEPIKAPKSKATEIVLALLGLLLVGALLVVRRKG